MNSQNITTKIAQTETAGARLDFSDLMARIEADGGKSTAEQYTAAKSPAGKIIGVAACFAAVVTLSAAALITIGIASGGMMAAESADMAYDMVLDESVAEDCAPEVFTEPQSPAEGEADMETAAPSNTTVQTAVSESDVSDSDVSDSDTGEGE